MYVYYEIIKVGATSTLHKSNLFNRYIEKKMILHIAHCTEAEKTLNLRK